MATAEVITGDVVIRGNLQPSTISQPANSIADVNVGTPAAGAAGVASSKLNHRYHKHWPQPNTTATTETRPLFITYGTSGTLVAFKAGSIAPCAGAATITIDLYKNGASVLSAPITLNSSNVARVATLGTITAATTAAGDWFDAVITATAGGGTLGTGLFVELVIDETPS